MRVAYFISSHGFSHAARACAVMEAVRQRQPEVRFELFTEVPSWFFVDSLGPKVGHHPIATDFGMVQINALEEDLEATAAELKQWIPFRSRRIEELKRRIEALGSELVICDIAPLGLAVARQTGLKTLLIENFTWDWVYRHYAADLPTLRPIADYLEKTFALADRRIQTEPCCKPARGAQRVPPMSRQPRTERREVRERLGVPPNANLALVTMGGIEWSYSGIETRLARVGGSGFWLVIPGGSRLPRISDQLVLLPHRSDFYHPDLVHAADTVIGKLGYSTLAEVYRAGIPFGYVPRPEFPESPKLERWIKKNLPHLRIEAESFTSGRWFEEVSKLLGLPKREEPAPDGSEEVAEVILEVLGKD